MSDFTNSTGKKITHWYLHIDLDAFFASVEQLDFPEYRGKPVIVGGKPEDRRNVVSTASYEARKYGVHSAMPTFQAYKLCPNGIFVYPRMRRYSELSYQIMNIFREFSPDVDQMSIDEAFIDLTGTERLFGKPEDTAIKIKKMVKQQTGLTVSVGLATTKYLAKIASGYSKPDGFFHILEGQEQNFMLNLPLNKVWGLGSKSQEVLKSKGFRSTKDIYEKSYEMLNFLFGQNMATFLYNVVRGKEMNSFSRVTKNHSISAEITFSYDTDNIYTAETTLLELAQGVFFRLLKQNGFSRTVFVKIRYDDFSTVSAQETYEQNILTLDSFFEAIKRLFEKKYVKGRGIRLLGVGFENVTNEEKNLQQELFENKDEKKSAVEKAILNLTKKHPEIKITKARTLKTILMLILFNFILNKNNLFSQDNQINQLGAGTLLPDSLPKIENSTEEKEKTALFEWEINDKNNVDFFLTGFWQSQIESSFDARLGKNLPFHFKLNVPVFKQEVELTTSIELNKKFFFSADFADSFKKNTFSLGYKNGDLLKTLFFSNRNIFFPEYYSVNDFGFGLNGGKIQTPGVFAKIQSKDERFTWDFIFRYEMTKTQSSTFYGKNKVSDSKINIDNFVYGKQFIFPKNSDFLTQIKDIYVESKDGNYKDEYSKRYKVLSKSDYSLLSSENTINFNQSVFAGKNDNKIPTILITFYSPVLVDSIISSLGEYDDKNSFLGQIQNEFNLSHKKYDLQKYSYKLKSKINEENALVIQNTTGFSPFLQQNIYDAGIIIKNSSTEIFVINEKNEKQMLDFQVNDLYNSNSQIGQDFFVQNHFYAKINYIEEKTRFPFVIEYPEIYLNIPVESPIKILNRNLKSVNNFQIGTGISSSSVQVFVNDVLDRFAKYNENSGNVELSQNVNDTDKIYITWQEENEDAKNGSFAGGIGFLANFTPKLKADFSITGKIPLLMNKNYSVVSSKRNGFLSFTSGIDYKNENFAIFDKTSFSLLNNDFTDFLLVNSITENNEKTYYLAETSGFVTKIAPTINNQKLDVENNITIKNHTGLSDSQITGFKIPLEWNENVIENSTIIENFQDLFASVDIKLDNGNLIQNSDVVEFALFPNIPDFSENDFYQVFLQLGVFANNQDYGENPNDLIQIELTKKNANVEIPLDLSKNEWQTVKIHLTNKNKARLKTYFDARLIVKTKQINSKKKNGILYFGPYSPKVKSISTTQNDNFIVSTFQTRYKENFYASKVNFSNLFFEQMNNSSDFELSTLSFFDSADFSSYEKINFDFSFNEFSQENNDLCLNPNDIFLTIILDSQNSNKKFFEQENQIALKLEIKNQTKDKLFSNSNQLKKITIDKNRKKVLVDENELLQSEYNLFINEKIIPNRQKIIFNTLQNNKCITKGEFLVGNTYYSNSLSDFLISNKLGTTYKKNEIIKINNFDILKNFEIDINSMQNFINSNFGIDSSLNSKINIIGINTIFDFSLKNKDFQNAGHNIKNEKSLFKIIDFSDIYRINTLDQTSKKENSINVSFSKINFPLDIKTKFLTQENQLLSTQNIQTQILINPNFNIFKLDFSLNTDFSQKIKQENLFSFDYFTKWKENTKFAFSFGEQNAFFRQENYTSILKTSIPKINFSPQIEYSLNSSFNSTEKNQFSDKEKLKLTIPFLFKNKSFSFEIERVAGNENNILQKKLANYFDDTNHLFCLQKKRDWFYQAIPFFELFDSDLSKKINASFSSTYKIGFKRKMSNSLSDVFLPSAVNFSFSRSLTKNENTAEIYQLKAVISNNSINNFGKNSLNTYKFSWFKQEEIISNFTAIIKIPVDKKENTTFQISSYTQILFFINDNSTLNCAVDITFETNFSWQTRFTAIFNRPGNQSLLSVFIPLIFKSEKNSYIITRSNSFNTEIGQKEKLFFQKYDFFHNADTKINKNLTINTGLGTNISSKQNDYTTISPLIKIGAKVEF